MNKRLSVNSRVLRSALVWALLVVLSSNIEAAPTSSQLRELFARQSETGRVLTRLAGLTVTSPELPLFHNRHRRKISSSLLVNLTVPEGAVLQDEPVVLSCLASGPKPSIVYWLKDGKKINQDDNENLDAGNDSDEGRELTLTQVRSKLFIDCITVDDEAEYTCVAVSADAMESASYKLRVSRAHSAISKKKCRTHMKKSLGTHLGSPARITMWTYNKLAPIGANVVLVCHGSPNAALTWSSEEADEPISEQKNPRVRILENGNLEINDIRWTDMGGYACNVENEAGTDRQVAFLYPYAR